MGSILVEGGLAVPVVTGGSTCSSSSSSFLCTAADGTPSSHGRLSAVAVERRAGDRESLWERGKL